MNMNGRYPNKLRDGMAAVANRKKWVVLSHGRNTGNDFTVPPNSAIVYVPPKYSILGTRYAFNLLNKPIFKNEASLQRFLTFKNNENSYQVPINNKKYHMQMFVAGQKAPNLGLSFTNGNPDIQSKLGVYKLPFNSTRRRNLPNKNRLSSLMGSQPGVYFVFACRGEMCPRRIVKRHQLVGGGTYNAAATNRPPEGASVLNNLSVLRNALPVKKYLKRPRNNNRNINPALSKRR